MSLLIIGHLAHVSDYPHLLYVIAPIAWCHDASIEIRTKSPCELLKLVALGFVDNHQIKDSGSPLFMNAQNVLISDSTFVSFFFLAV